MSRHDVIDHLIGQALPLRDRRPITRDQAQKSYNALFEPLHEDGFAIANRFALAAFVALLHQDKVIAAFYLDHAKSHDRDLAEKVERIAADVIANGGTQQDGQHVINQGPYGTYPQGSLSREDQPGPWWQVPPSLQQGLSKAFIAALEHTHFLIFHPRDANKQAIENLQNAGWQTKNIVTLSQLVAFLSFQIRVVSGLRALASYQNGVKS